MALSTAPLPLEGPRYHVGRELLRAPDNDSHIVQFYEDEGFLLDVVEQYVRGGLEAGEPLVVIAPESHRRGLTQRLAAAGVREDALRATGQLTLLDARETLSRFMVGRRPDWERFKDVVGGALERTRTAGFTGRIRAYGEMVDLLWQDGLPDAALELEELWNELAGRHEFSLLCAYALNRFSQEAHGTPFRDICRAHTHVVPTERYSGLEDPDCRLREVTLLQQRAHALEVEVASQRRVERELREALARADAGGLGEDLHGRLGRAVQHTERLATAVEALIEVSSVSGGQLRLEVEEVDLAHLVHEEVSRSGEEVTRSGCRVSVLARPPVVGRWDGRRLRQVFRHLLGNALKFGAGRPVEVRVETSPRMARLVVRDEGIGIAVENHDRIFHRFEYAPPESPPALQFQDLGLGLWVSRQVVEMHGGSIRVESAPERGATFTVELPYQRG
jgi:signal transduction histidine kinase